MCFTPSAQKKSGVAAVNKFCFSISLVFLIIDLIYIKKRRLEFQYSILWTTVSVSLILLSVNGKLVQYLAACTGILYAPALLFLVGIIFCFLMVFYLMIVISDMKKKITRLIQENAILNDKITEGIK